MRFLRIWPIQKDPQEQLKRFTIYYVASYEVALGIFGVEIVIKLACCVTEA